MKREWLLKKFKKHQSTNYETPLFKAIDEFQKKQKKPIYYDMRTIVKCSGGIIFMCYLN